MGELPTKNENFQECTLLWDALEIDTTNVIEYNPGTIFVANRARYKDVEFCVSNNIKTFELKNTNYTADILSHSEDKICGFTKDLGAGKISVTGFVPEVFLSISRQFAREYFGKQSQDGIFVYERRDGDRSLFTVCSMLEEPEDVVINGKTFTVPPRRGTFITKDGDAYKQWEN